MGAGPYEPYYGPQASGTLLYPSQDDIFAWVHNQSLCRIAALEADIAALRAALAEVLPLMKSRTTGDTQQEGWGVYRIDGTPLWP